MLALNTSRGPIYSVVPWSSKPSIFKEILPLEKYFVPSVSQIELTNDQDQYRALFLQRRTDPSAMRGEKLFVQNCAVCHQQSQKIAPQGRLTVKRLIDIQKEQEFLSGGHPFIDVAFKLSEKDRRSIVRYLDAYRMENPK